MSEEMLIAIVDRIEEEQAVLELVDTKFLFNFPVKLLPDELHEGAAIEISFKNRPDIEKQRREKIRQLQNDLIQRSK